MRIRWSRSILLILLVLMVSTADAALLSHLVTSRHGAMPVRLQSLHIHGDIVGGMAETSVRMVLFNPNPDALEGGLQVSLEDRQQLTVFALDAGGVMRPAVLVPKVKDRKNAQTIRPCKGNAGVLEQTLDNSFTLSVCLMPPLRTRTVELKFIETMTRDGKAWAYHLQQAYAGVVPDVALSFNIRGSGDVPTVSGAFGAPRLDRDARGYFFHIAKTDFMPDGELDILIPTAQHTLTYAQKNKDETYFIAEIPAAVLPSPRSPVRSIRVAGASAVLMDFTDAQQGWMRVVGKLRATNAQLKIKTQGEPDEMNITVSSDDLRHPMAARWWAHCRLLELTSGEGANRAAIGRLEAQFMILTRDTSLIVPGRAGSW